MHFADTHFGVETYGKVDPQTGINTRLADFRDTLLRGIDIALERGIDLAVFAGDAYKGRDPSQTQQREFAKCLRRLTEAGVPVALLTGNHDVPNVRGRAHAMEIYRTLGVERLKVISRPEVVLFETGRGPVQVAGLPYLMRGFLLAGEEFRGLGVEQTRLAIEERYRTWIDDLAAQCDPSLPTILAGHFWVYGASPSAWRGGELGSLEPRVSSNWLKREPFDYVAMGHIHRHQEVEPGSQPPIVYCGSPDRIDFGERAEPKGFVLAEVSNGHATWEFVEIPGTRRFIEMDVDATGTDPTESVVRRVLREELQDAIIRLTYRVPEEAAPLIDEKRIRKALEPAFMVASLRRETVRANEARRSALSESLEPLTALRMYLTERGKSEIEVERLMAYAERLTSTQSE